MTKVVPGLSDFVLLQPLQWNMRYEVEITARNVKGLSEPTFVKFSMPQKPDITGIFTSRVHTLHKALLEHVIYSFQFKSKCTCSTKN